MKRYLMYIVGCGTWIFAVTLLPQLVFAGSADGDDKARAVNHRNEKYDTNHDGKLDEAEIAAMKADRAAKRQANLLAKYDANKNGAIDPDEEAKHQEDLAKRREQRAARKKAKEAGQAAPACAMPEEDEEEMPAEEPKP